MTLEIQQRPHPSRATVSRLLSTPVASVRAFEASWGHSALLRLPPPELVARAQLQFGAAATVPARPGGTAATQALLMMRAFFDMHIDFLTGARGRAVLGRAREVEIWLEHESVSKHHATVEWNERGTWLADLHSLNGTVVNGQNRAGPTCLNEGDLIRLGDASVVFVTTSTLFLQLESVRHT